MREAAKDDDISDVFVTQLEQELDLGDVISNMTEVRSDAYKNKKFIKYR